MAQAALTQCALDRLVVVPTGEAWHKPGSLSPASHRLAMARLAFEPLPRVVVDPRETQRSGPSYTWDTLAELRHETPDAQWFLVLGQDQWERLGTWHRWRELAGLATIVVAVRPDQSSGEVKKFPHFDAQRHGAEVQAHGLSLAPQAISSTRIRQQLGNPLQRSHALSALLPEAVAGYISHHHLFQAAQ